MEIKWQKNAHILIKSNGFIKVDSENNIRRASFLGRIWIYIKDFLTDGGATVKINIAIQKTIDAVGEELKQVKKEIIPELDALPDPLDKTYTYKSAALTAEQKKHLEKAQTVIGHLILAGNGAFTRFFGAPNYDYRTECLRDLPMAVQKLKQANATSKKYRTLEEIDDFFTLSFITAEKKRLFVTKEINARDKMWTG